MKSNLLTRLIAPCATILILFSLIHCTRSPQSISVVPPYEPGLALQMHYLQVWTHKLGLSIEAENMELADFYHHELEDATEDLIDSIPEYKDIEIARLTETMLVPILEQLEDALEAGNWSDIRSNYSALITSCNACHAATGYGYIKITEGFGNNPFNQSFD